MKTELPSFYLKNLPLFQRCTNDFFQKMDQLGVARQHEKGKVLFLNGDQAESFYLIKSGWVKLFRETLDGAQAVVDILPQNHIFGETSIFEDDLYPYSAEVAEKADIVALPLAVLKKEIETNSNLALDMLSAMARYRRQQDQEIEHMALQTAPQRIGCFLLRLADQDAEGKVTIHLPYDKMLLASRLGMKPETFSRGLSKLKDHTNIQIKGSTIEMDNLIQLSEYSCAACSSEFPCKDLATKASQG